MRTPTAARASPGKPSPQEVVASKLQQFLDDWHYCILHSSLAKTWPRSKVLSIALDILKLQGLALTDEEHGMLPTVEEVVMLDAVSAKMPLDVATNLEALSLQLQLSVSLATRLRNALEDSNDDDVQAVLEDQSSSGMAQLFLQQAVVTAGHEVHEIHACQASWKSNMERRMERLRAATTESEQMQQQLLETEAQLTTYSGSVKDKSKQVLLMLAECNTAAVVSTHFAAWRGHLLRQKEECDVRDGFKNRIINAENSLRALKARKPDRLNALFLRCNKHGAEELRRRAWSALRLHWRGERLIKTGTVAEAATMEADVRLSKQEVATTAGKVIGRMALDLELGLLAASLRAWLQQHLAARQARHLNVRSTTSKGACKDQALRFKLQVQARIAHIRSLAKLDLLQDCVIHWKAFFKEARHAAEAKRLAKGTKRRLEILRACYLSTATQVRQRLTSNEEEFFLCRYVFAWRLECRVKQIKKHFSKRLDGRRQQLKSVQSLFSAFSQQLDEGLDHDDVAAHVSNRHAGHISPGQRRQAGDGQQSHHRGSHCQQHHPQHYGVASYLQSELAEDDGRGHQRRPHRDSQGSAYSHHDTKGRLEKTLSLPSIGHRPGLA
eukprot:TRINITY_DN111488_c0_g1_i1.p1 TRINITY_DN111488_c0_g1~~TRINITY_DN111488_c0_g1_i1.p1  ORF type:complete len:611 (+),score=158.30 TRINITY_DN111488_c0_g1_i1:156-1988(+)